MKIKILPLILLLPFFVFSQSAAERIKIASFSNQEGNQVLAIELKAEETQRKFRLANYLKNNPGLSRVVPTEGIGKIELLDILPDGQKIYAKTSNEGAAITARTRSLYNGGSLGLNIQGQDMIAGVWDAGSARSTHREFVVGGTSKIFVMDGSEAENHATHVAGTIAAQGIQSNVRGIAFNSSINSFDWTNDISEMLNESSEGLLVSNHSYSIGALSNKWFYGAYDSRARQIDQMCYNNPYYLPVIAAGNDRGGAEAPASAQNAEKGGYDLIFGQANAKNVLTVAAVYQFSNFSEPTELAMSGFSSWGPSDDGRIKPEISMKGVSVRSTMATTDSSYGISSGTSMAAPGITGVVVLLQQYYHQLYNNYMKSASVKGLILHTADEAGYDLGPDYRFGWGLVNAEKAAKTIRDKDLSMNRTVIEELDLSNGSSYSKLISANGTFPLQVSISWTDPEASTQNNGTTDPATKYLVNDLDVKVTSSNGTVFYPWKLQGMDLPNEAATNDSTNDVDNFERVDIDNPSGQYTVTVTHKGNLKSKLPQPFSLIITSDNLSSLNVKDQELGSAKIEIYPNPASMDLNVKSDKKITGYKIIDITGRIIKVGKPNGKIDVSQLAKGDYVIILNDEANSFYSYKFIKQ